MPSTTALRISDAQRRARLVRRHLLAGQRPVDPAQVVGAVVALHSTDPASVHLSAATRGALPISSALDDVLYVQHTLVRTLGMRRTMFVVHTDFAAIVHAAATRAVAARERRRLIGFLADNGVTTGDPAAFLTDLEEATLAELARREEAYGAELGDAVPGLRRQIMVVGGAQSLTTRVLSVLAAEGRIMRGRPRGSWLSSQYGWSLSPTPPPSEQDLPTEQARAELAEAYLRAYAPATPADLQWWTGWTAGETKRALAAIETVPVELDGSSTSSTNGSPIGMVLPDDVDDAPAAEPSARLLPALDPSVMGWTKRDFYLDPAHRDHTQPGALFDRSGNPGPTVWWDGRIVGGWAQRADGEVVVQLLRDLDKTASDQVDAEAARVQSWLGAARVTPRFRTPLERALVS